MATLRALTSAGDRHITWDPAAVAAGDVEATAAVREAERLFAAVRAQGGTAFTLGPSHTTTRIEHFDRTAEQVVLVPRIVGG